MGLLELVSRCCCTLNPSGARSLPCFDTLVAIVPPALERLACVVIHIEVGCNGEPMFHATSGLKVQALNPPSNNKDTY